MLSIAVVHLALFLLVARLDPLARVARSTVRGMITISLPRERRAVLRPARRIVRIDPPPIIPSRAPLASASPPIAGPASSVEVPAAGGCALAEDAGSAVANDPAALAEIDALPPASRSAADAVMLWNGQWLDPGPMPITVDPNSLRRVVGQVVAAAPAECRDLQVTGPRFIPVFAGDRTVMLVIGSGLWRWADLLASPDCLGDQKFCDMQPKQSNANRAKIHFQK